MLRALIDGNSFHPMTGAHLQWTNLRGEQEVYVLDSNEVLIGRKADSDIIFPNHSVSRHHAKFVKNGEGYFLVDLPNTLGTYVNGQQVTQHELRHGDKIRLGRDRTEIRYLTGPEDLGTSTRQSPVDDFGKSWAELWSVLPPDSIQHSDLEKMSSLLEFQYQWEKTFSAEKTFRQILDTALRISKAERGYILLKRQDQFEYVSGLGEGGEPLRESDFQTSQSVARQVARDGVPVYTAEGLDEALAQQQSIINLRLRSVACMPLRWLSPQSAVPSVNGVLYLDSTQSMRVLSDLDQKILSKLALEAGNVFEKLELIKTLEQSRLLELELSMAQSELRAADALRRAESKVLLAEYTASMGRFAAALSHELNSPIGALKSALETSAVIAEKKAVLPPERRNEVEEVEANLRRAAMESLERLHQIILRMQRFTNLDRSEILPVDLNSMLQDVVDILKPEITGSVAIETFFQPLPSILVRPQQMSAVFANLLRSAIESLSGDGNVRLKTRQTDSQVEVAIEDDGKGMPAEELANIFDPTFKVKKGRVSTGNWSLFSARQIVREHGGEIDIESSAGKGTAVRVRLPDSGSK